MKSTSRKLYISKSTISNLQQLHTYKGGTLQAGTDIIILPETTPSICPSLCPPPSVVITCDTCGNTCDQSCVQSCFFNTCYETCASLPACHSQRRCTEGR
jgi:hypothetical protein